jgi:ribosomal protein L7/L12
MLFKVLLVVILVLIALVMVRMMFLRRERGRELFVTEATGRTPLPTAGRPKADGGVDATPLEFEVIRLLEQRKKIQAIKVVRQHTRLGLKEAKDLVEEVERTGRLRLPPMAALPHIDDEDVLDQARRLKSEGKAIEAIRMIRQHTRLGLKDAKDVYDRL